MSEEEEQMTQVEEEQTPVEPVQEAAPAEQTEEAPAEPTGEDAPSEEQADESGDASDTAGDDGFMPKIVGFLCNWCSYAGSDLAGISRLQMPATVRIIRLMCSGGLDPGTVFEPLIKGADGVLLMGCHPGDCHYLTGNYQTVQRVNIIEKMMELVDMDPERIHLEWVSASEGARFAEVVENYTNTIKRLGPNPVNNGDAAAEKLKRQLIGARDAVSSFRIRSVTGRAHKFINEGNVYGDKYTPEELDEIMDEMVHHEFIRRQILNAVTDTPRTVEEMAEMIGEETVVVFYHVARLWRNQIILPVHSEGVSPKYLLAGGGA